MYVCMQVVSFVVGYVQQSFLMTFYVFTAGVVLAMLVCLPDYPFYNAHPMAWQLPVRAVEGAGDGKTGEVEGQVGVEEVKGADEEEEEQGEEEEEVVVVKKKKKGSKKPAAASNRK